MFVRISLGIALISSGILNASAQDGAVVPASGARPAEQVRHVCRQVWRHGHYEEKCRTIRHAPPPPSRIDQPPSPPNSRKDGPQSGAVKHPQGVKNATSVGVKRPASA